MNIISGARISEAFERWGNVALPIREEILNELPWLTVSKGDFQILLDEPCILTSTLDWDDLIQHLSEKKIDFKSQVGQVTSEICYSKHGMSYNVVFSDRGEYLYTNLLCQEPELWIGFNGKSLKDTFSISPHFNDQELVVLFEAMTGSRTGP